jgi:hypothetical protein
MTEPYLFEEWKHKPDRNREGRIQIAVVKYVNLVAPEAIIFHIPNGGWRGRTEAARFKALGVTPGIPDLCLVLPGGKVAWWEIKADGGRISPSQAAMFSRFDESGHEVSVIHSIDEARTALRRLGVETRETA